MSEQLSRRKKQMISILLEEKDFISTSTISSRLEVSRRTILREIGSVEKWLVENNVKLNKITGKGIRLEITPEQRDMLKKMIVSEETSEEYTPFERQKKLLLELLNATEPKKIYYFSSMLNVSEATISYDLDKIEEWLKPWQLILIRKPGYGILIEGRESNFRKAIISVFNEYFDRGELLTLIRDDFIDSDKLLKKASIKKTLLEVVGYTMLESIEEAVISSNVLEVYPLADSAYAALIIHLSLAIKRLSEGETIHFDRLKLEEILEAKEFDYAKTIIDKAAQIFNIDIPIDEIGYVALHIKGSRLKHGRSKDDIQVEDYEVIYLVELLIKEMENITGYMLVGDQQLLVGLINHFGPALSRIKQGLLIKNPLLNEMKTRYKDYYLSVSIAAKTVSNHIGMNLPDDEIAFLTMHFAAALESIKKVVESSWRVAIVCSTGIGSSKLLEARVKKQYKHMKIIGVYSTIGLEAAIGNVDLIISTVSVKHIKTPVVVVSPLLLEEDMRKVENALNTIVPLRHTDIANTSSNFIDTLNQLQQLAKVSLELLENFFIIECHSDNVTVLAETASKHISVNQDYMLLKNELLERERKGTTWFSDKGRLLHCQSNYMTSVRFGFVLGDETFAAVMVGHNNLTLNIRKLLGQISLNLMENSKWLSYVNSKDLNSAYYELEQMIQSYLATLLN